MSDNRSDIALDDPNFWQKWAKKAGVDETALAMKVGLVFVVLFRSDIY